ncbi:hypothetical protein LJC42_00100 [Eubacteriales bacterium OttesenSCG-928-K08]|nr:hypothetical protein [Eubacteriales bacterium OttesenSCG-928-K08]
MKQLDNNMENETGVNNVKNLPTAEEIKVPKLKFALAGLAEEEIVYVCKMVTPKEIRLYFQKYPKEFAGIRPGFRASSLSDDDTIMLVCKNATRPFVSTFLENWIAIWLQDIRSFRRDLESNGASPEESLLRALPESVFSEDIDLFFKATNEDYSTEYIALFKSALQLLKISHRIVESENETANTAEKQNSSEIVSIKNTNVELLASMDQLQQELEAEKLSHSEASASLVEFSATIATLRQDLDAEIAKNESFNEEFQSMQAELDRFYQLSEYVDKESADAYSNEYEFTSICQVFFDYRGKPLLSRLADIKDGEISRFVKSEDVPYYFENRDRLFWSNGPREEGFVGIWQWSAVPNKSDPSTDYVTTMYNSTAKIIEIAELAECYTYADIAKALMTKPFPATQESKMLFTCKNASGQIIGLLCNGNDFELNGGHATIKPTTYTLPMFEISSADILIAAGKKIYRFTSLGMPQGIFKIRDPLTVVKEIVITRATSAAFRQKGLSKKEAQHCQNFLRELPLETMYQEIADAYSCTETQAQKYVEEFVLHADSYLSANDIDVETLAVALERNSGLVTTCKSLLTSAWEVEHTEKLQMAQQKLDEIESIMTARHTELSTLEDDYHSLQDKKAKVRTELDAQVALASDVELRVAERISAAKKNAADFICEMAFSTPGRVFEEYSVAASSALGPSLTRRTIDCIQGEDVEDIDLFTDGLADNLSIVGYDDIVAAQMAQMVTFCIDNRMPIVCSTNTYKIADCIAAMFSGSGAYTITLSLNQQDCIGICASIQQEAIDKKCVVVINGVFDGLSLHAFNEIVFQADTWGKNAILLFPLNGVDTMMIPSHVWDQTMFIDGDLGLEHFEIDRITMHTTTVEFGTRYAAKEASVKRKQLKTLAGIISNTAMLNYAKYMAVTDSSLKDDTQTLTQIVLHALSSGKKDRLLEALSSMGIDTEENKKISRYL